MAVSDSTHTPLPWTTAGIANPSTDPRMSLWGPRPPGAQSGEWIAKDLTPANVRFILTAVNSHADLLAALKGLLAHVESWKVRETAGGDIARSRTAIAKAEAQS